MKDGKPVVLYVDDDPDMLDTVGLVVTAAGYIFERAATAEEGLRKYKSAAPDFVLVDLMMEEVDAGTNLVKELRLLGNKAPVYMLSSVGDQLNLQAQYGDLGLTGVLQKPVAPKTLTTLLKAKLGV